MTTVPAGAAIAAQRASAPDQIPYKRLISSRTSQANLRALLAGLPKWRPFPLCTDREAWSGLPHEVREAAIGNAEKQLGQEWPTLPASLYLNFQRTGSRSEFESRSAARRTRLRDLVIGECCEGKGRFMDEIVDGIWAISEESTWCAPAHIGPQKAGIGLPETSEPIPDLTAGETAALFAWTHYLLGAELDRVSKRVCPRIRREVTQRVLDPYHARTDFWWQGLNSRRPVNNWNPWVNSNILTSLFLLETDEERRAERVWKVLTSVDRFLDSYHDDGGCDEGPSYWGHAGAMLFECLERIEAATHGKLSYFDIPLVKEIGRYIYRVHIADDWYVNFADASARVHIYGDLVYRYGKRINDPLLMQQGAYGISLGGDAWSSAGSIGRQLTAMFNLEETRKADTTPPLIRGAWLPGTQHMVARRKEGSTSGLFLAVQGGHNAESHNHNDVGNFVVYADGKPVLIDVGVESYTAKTFSSRRYEIWTMQSSWHNLPEINGVMQAAGRKYEATDVRHQDDGERANLSMDIASAWPAEAEVQSWVRDFAFDRPKNEISIRDSYKLTGAARSIELNLITVHDVTIRKPGELSLGGRATLFYDDNACRLEVDEKTVDDRRLRASWGPMVRRIRLCARSPQRTGEFITRVVGQ